MPFDASATAARKTNDSGCCRVKDISDQLNLKDFPHARRLTCKHLMNIDYLFVHKFNLDFFAFGGIFARVTAAHKPRERESVGRSCNGRTVRD